MQKFCIFPIRLSPNDITAYGANPSRGKIREYAIVLFFHIFLCNAFVFCNNHDPPPVISYGACMLFANFHAYGFSIEKNIILLQMRYYVYLRRFFGTHTRVHCLIYKDCFESFPHFVIDNLLFFLMLLLASCTAIQSIDVVCMVSCGWYGVDKIFCVISFKQKKTKNLLRHFIILLQSPWINWINAIAGELHTHCISMLPKRVASLPLLNNVLKRIFESLYMTNHFIVLVT